MKVTINQTAAKSYWIDFKEPETDKRPYRRMFNAFFELEKTKDGYELWGYDGRVWGFMHDNYRAPYIRMKEDEAEKTVGKVVEQFLTEYFKVDAGALS